MHTKSDEGGRCLPYLLFRDNKKTGKKFKLLVAIYLLRYIIRVTNTKGLAIMIGYAKADRFWEVEAESRFWRVVEANGLESAVENVIETGEIDIDLLLFDMWDNGEYTPSDAEILAEVKNIVR